MGVGNVDTCLAEEIPEPGAAGPGAAQKRRGRKGVGMVQPHCGFVAGGLEDQHHGPWICVVLEVLENSKLPGLCRV